MFERALGPRADADELWSAAACFGKARMLLQWYGAPTRCRRCEGRRQGCRRQPRFAISPSHPPPPPKPSPRRGCHRHAFSRQKPSQAPGLHCPLLACERFFSPRTSFFAWHLFLRLCVPGGRRVAAGLRSPSCCHLAVVLAVASRQKLMIDVKAGSKQLLIWLLLFHLQTFWSIMGIFIHLVTLNGIWCSTSPGTMKEWYCTEIV